MSCLSVGIYSRRCGAREYDYERQACGPDRRRLHDPTPPASPRRHASPYKSLLLCSLPSHDWLPPRVYALNPHAIGLPLLCAQFPRVPRGFSRSNRPSFRVFVSTGLFPRVCFHGFVSAGLFLRVCFHGFVSACLFPR
eukprot:874997-Prorocentrum_minimum.AAC.1